MNSAVLDLWITRILNLASPPSVPNKPTHQKLYDQLKTHPGHLLVTRPSLRQSRFDVISSTMFHLAIEGSRSTPRRGWLVIDVPVSSRFAQSGEDSTKVVHRMIRRLYFASVLQGLAQLPSLRETVQGLRLSYLQTRGGIAMTGSETSSAKAGAGVEFELSLKPSLKGRLTASEEVTLVESLTANMTRFDLFEAEDHLLHDLQLLTELRLQVDAYASRVRSKKIPRWEHVKSFFQSMYRDFQDGAQLHLTPVFVFEAFSVSAVASLMALLSEAAALASTHNAKLVVMGGDVLRCAWFADLHLGSPIFRGEFVPDNHSQTSDPNKVRGLDRFLERDDKLPHLSPEVRMVLEEMHDTRKGNSD